MIEYILNSGIDLTISIQNIGGWLLNPMQFFSFLGTEQFFLLCAPVIYWCLDAQLGLRVGLFLMASGNINYALKVILHSPRPYWYNLDVLALSTESSFGLPSGHAQNAVVVWGTLAAFLKKRLAWIGGILLIFMIGLSRIYLGVHFPSDVLLGWVVGIGLLILFLRLESTIIEWLTQHKLAIQVLIVLTFSLFLLILGLFSKWLLADWTIPLNWIKNATAAAPGAEPINPLSLEGALTYSGAFFGLACGAIIIKSTGGFITIGSLAQRTARFIIGVIVVLILWRGLGSIFPGGQSLAACILRYFRYGLVGFWVSGGAPWLFIRIGIAQPEREIVKPPI